MLIGVRVGQHAAGGRESVVEEGIGRLAEGRLDPQAKASVAGGTIGTHGGLARIEHLDVVETVV